MYFVFWPTFAGTTLEIEGAFVPKHFAQDLAVFKIPPDPFRDDVDRALERLFLGGDSLGRVHGYIYMFFEAPGIGFLVPEILGQRFQTLFEGFRSAGFLSRAELVVQIIQFGSGEAAFDGLPGVLRSACPVH